MAAITTVKNTMVIDITQRILGELRRRDIVRREGKGWRTRCPDPGHEDHRPSFFLYPGGGGRCFSQCGRYWSPPELAKLLGVSMTSVRSGLTVAKLAMAKGLPGGFLKSLGVDDGTVARGRAWVEIPYRGQDSKVIAVRRRYALEGNRRFAWRRGDRTTLYGLQRLVQVQETGYVILVEGESDCWVLWYQGLPALGVPGAAAWRSEFAAFMRGLKIYLWQEPDAGGQTLARSVSADLPDCRIMEAPVEAKDPAELYLQDPKAFKARIEALMKVAKPVAQCSVPLPEITVTDRHLRDIAGDAWSALQALNDPPVVYQRGHVAVDLLSNEEGVPFTRPLDRAAFRGRLDRVADFVREYGDGEIKPAPPPNDVVADMLATPELPLPVLRGIAEAPFFRPLDILVAKSGYDVASGHYLHLVEGLRELKVPEKPTNADTNRARSFILDELLGEFPFEGDADLAHAVAVILLPFTRLLIDGPTPLHLIESPTPGTGKGLLAGVMTVPAMGRAPAVMTEGRDEEEWRKRITAKLMGGEQVILIDNVRGRLDSSALSAALTTRVWEDRLLGHSQMVALPITCTWIATANNPRLSVEIARRSVSIRLDAATERPWERTGFRHGSLGRWAMQHRDELVWSAVTLIQRWIASGQPQGQQVLGSYESWSEIVGGILEVVGVPGFLMNQDRVYTEADQEVAGWTEFCGVWWQENGDRSITAEALFGMAQRYRLLLDVWAGRNEHTARTRLGIALVSMRDRVLGPFCLRVGPRDGHTKIRTYRLELLGRESVGVVAGVAGRAGASPEAIESPANEEPDEVDTHGNSSESPAPEVLRVPETPRTPRTPRVGDNEGWGIEL